MLFKWTEFKARKNRMIMRGDVLTGVELSGIDSNVNVCVPFPFLAQHKKQKKNLNCGTSLWRLCW